MRTKCATRRQIFSHAYIRIFISWCDIRPTHPHLPRCILAKHACMHACFSLLTPLLPIIAMNATYDYHTYAGHHAGFHCLSCVTWRNREIDSAKDQLIMLLVSCTHMCSMLCGVKRCMHQVEKPVGWGGGGYSFNTLDM